MFEPTLSIDLGASYAKVAYRPNCLPHRIGTLERDAHVLVLDGSPLIPTLGIQTGSARRPWVFGQEAAKMKPGPDMGVFYNWKARLFRPKTELDKTIGTDVAIAFFRWLQGRIEEHRIDLGNVHTRVALPALRDGEDLASRIAQCMKRSGWRSPLIVKATEPHANLVGLFTEGRNVVMRGRELGPRVHYGETFGWQNSYIAAARRRIIQGSGSNLFTVLVIDIGAFTVDLALLTMDSDEIHIGDGLASLRQESHAIGIINDLDRPLFQELQNRYGFRPAELTFHDREMLKAAIYRGVQYSLLTRSKGTMRVGDRADFAEARWQSEKFVQRLWKKACTFIDASRKPDIALLTGGGSEIIVLCNVLAKEVKNRRIPTLDLSTDREKPRRDGWHQFQHTGETVDRLATALGGASIALQSTQEPAPGTRYTPERPSQRPPVGPGMVSCRCQGGNKDCCFCGGRGFYYEGT